MHTIAGLTTKDTKGNKSTRSRVG